MRYFFIALLFASSAYLLSCNNDKKENTQDAAQKAMLLIDSVEKRMAEHRNEGLNYQTALFAVKVFDEFVSRYPENPKSPDLLFKAGEISANIKLPQPALNYFQRYLKKYPKGDKAAPSLFMQAFIYEEQLNDTANARKLYSKVIEEYPGTRMAQDASASIQNLGKSPEELIREFEKLNSAPAAQ